MDWSIVLIFIGIAVVVTLLLQREISRVETVRRFGLRTTGVVTGHKVRIGRNSTIRPLIKYTTKQGRTFELESKVGAAIPLRCKGQQVTVLYDEQEPASFILDDETDESAPYVGIIMVWLLVVAAAVAKWQST